MLTELMNAGKQTYLESTHMESIVKLTLTGFGLYKYNL